MQPFGQFQLVHRSAFRTRLNAPAGCRPAALAMVRRRLVACDGILAVAVDPDTASVTVRHSPAFSWGTVGPAAWRLDDGPATPMPAPPSAAMPLRTPAAGRAPHPSLAGIVEELVSLAIEGVIARRPAAQIMQDMARSFLATTLREPDRA